METAQKNEHQGEMPSAEAPLAEKDEVKQAEERTRQAQNEASVASEMKIRTEDNPEKETE
ncbi:hypothetical protein [Arcticibacter sp. MXS-1]|uniref:hypothetical protein n=1 Tax=Arcticibacter sp. MXS-1 TaxID=3341726 RepID=UPI0035A8A940